MLLTVCPPPPLVSMHALIKMSNCIDIALIYCGQPEEKDGEKKKMFRKKRRCFHSRVASDSSGSDYSDAAIYDFSENKKM